MPLLCYSFSCSGPPLFLCAGILRVVRQGRLASGLVACSSPTPSSSSLLLDVPPQRSPNSVFSNWLPLSAVMSDFHRLRLTMKGTAGGSARRVNPGVPWSFPFFAFFEMQRVVCVSTSAFGNRDVVHTEERSEAARFVALAPVPTSAPAILLGRVCQLGGAFSVAMCTPIRPSFSDQEFLSGLYSPGLFF